jgi:splicing factor U2AF subunit
VQYREPFDGEPAETIEPTKLKIPELVGTSWIDDKAPTGNRISVQGLPIHLTDHQMREFFEMFGMIKFLNIARDEEGSSGGYGFIEYDDPRNTELAVEAINAMVWGDQTITLAMMDGEGVRRTAAPPPELASMVERVNMNAQWAMILKRGMDVGKKPDCVVQILNMVYSDDLLDSAEYKEIVDELRNEASRYGAVLDVVIPRPQADGLHTADSGVGKAFVQFQDRTAARKFHAETNGRKFGERVMCCAFYPLELFMRKKYVLTYV